MTKMKDSCVIWIGDVPENWGVKRIRHTIRPDEFGIRVGPFGSSLTDTVVSETQGQYKVYGQANLIRHDFSFGDNYVTEHDFYRLKNYEVMPGDVLLSMMGTIGKCSVVPDGIQSGIMDSHLIKIRLGNIMFPKYFEFVYEQSGLVFEQLLLNSKGSIMNGLNSGIVKDVFIPIPPLPEQQAIAAFLDDRCGQIDGIVADLERQVEILRQYKKALITETVTKGLDKTAPMKDSGIHWIGEMPRHWALSRLKDGISVLTDYTANGSFATLADNVEYLDDGYARVVRLTDLRVDFENDGIYVSEDAYNFLGKSSLFGGEILVANVGAYAGLMCEMPVVDFRATLGPNMFLILTDTSRLLPHYLYLLGLSKPIIEQLEMKATASAQPKLNKQDVKTVYMALPPIEEQESIIEFLDRKCAETDDLIAEKQKAAETMRQYKKSLIYEYVTGKKRVAG